MTITQTLPEILAEIATPEYAGLPDDEIVRRYNAKTAPVSVPVPVQSIIQSMTAAEISGLTPSQSSSLSILRDVVLDLDTVPDQDRLKTFAPSNSALYAKAIGLKNSSERAFSQITISHIERARRGER